MSYQSLGGYAYGLGVPMGVILIILAVILLNYLCKSKGSLPSEPAQGTNNSLRIITTQLDGGDLVGTCQRGFDDTALSGFPTVLYSHDKLISKAQYSASCCCSICLMDYKDTDLLRLLPDCDHRFHLKCVDPWLQLNPTCPVCRNSPLPTPLATPLADHVEPLTTRAD